MFEPPLRTVPSEGFPCVVRCRPMTFPPQLQRGSFVYCRRSSGMPLAFRHVVCADKRDSVQRQSPGVRWFTRLIEGTKTQLSSVLFAALVARAVRSGRRLCGRKRPATSFLLWRWRGTLRLVPSRLEQCRRQALRSGSSRELWDGAGRARGLSDRFSTLAVGVRVARSEHHGRHDARGAHGRHRPEIRSNARSHFPTAPSFSARLAAFPR